MIFFKWLLTALALIAAAYFVPGIEVSGFYIALIVALVLGLVNLIIKPILILLTLPINLLTFGLFTLVINAALFWFVASFIDGFNVETFWAAFWGALLVAFVTSLGNKLLEKKPDVK